MKKMKRFSMEPSPYAPSSSSYPEGIEARARFRHQSLMQDFVELQKEIEAKRKKLLKANKKKRELLTVVKFLQKKVQSFSKKPSQKVQSRVKKQHLKIPPSSDLYDKLSKDSQEVKNGEEMDEYQTEIKALTVPSKRKISWRDQISVRV